MKDWTQLKAGDVMTSPLITLEKDTALHEAALTLSESKISGALVVDNNGDAIGVASLFDIVSYLAGIERPENEPGGFYRYAYPRFSEGGDGWDRGWDEVEESSAKNLPIAEIMTPQILSVPAEMLLPEVIKTMATRHIHRVFVTREDKPVGVITTMDVLKKLAGASTAKPARHVRSRG